MRKFWEMPKSYDITDKELEALMAVERHTTLKDAAETLGMPRSTLATRLMRLRDRARAAKRFLKAYERWAMKLPKYLME